jgi:S-adenosylmethionine/arginine decarboxylase-like enzyme
MLKHLHLIVRATVTKPPGEADLERMQSWFKDLIESIGMKILSGPYTVYSNMEGNRGFTGVCVIETSHIALHTWDEENPAVVQLDVYTCSQMEIETVFTKLEEFEPRMVEYTYIDRDNGIQIIDEGKIDYEYI